MSLRISNRTKQADLQDFKLDKAVGRILSALSTGNLSEKFLWDCAACDAATWVEALQFLTKNGLIEKSGSAFRRTL